MAIWYLRDNTSLQTAWNSADKAAAVTLSNNNLTATTTGAGAVRAGGNSYSSGKYYFEVNVTASTSDLSFGISNFTSTLASLNQVGSNTNSIGLYPFFNCDLFINNVNLWGAGTADTTGVYRLAFDFGNKLAWFSTPRFRTNSTPWNKSGTADPATGVGGVSLTTLAAGPYVPAFGDDATGGAVTLSASAPSFAFGIPTGFTAWDTSTVGWSQVAPWSSGASKSAGALIRQLATPTVNNERVFVALTAGTTAGTEPTWVVTKGAKTTDNTITWQECTGQPGVCGDLTNCPDWNSVKNAAVALGYIISNTTDSFLFICTTAGTAGSGSEPTWNTTAGQTTTDNTVTWTSIGAVGNFAAWAASSPRLLNLLTAPWAAGGDTIYVGSDHAETQTTAMNLGGGSSSNPTKIFCVPTGTIPPTSLTTGASISSNATITMAAVAATGYYAYGLAFNTGVSIIDNSALITTATCFFENCTFKLNNATSTTRIELGNTTTGQSYAFHRRNCSFIFGNVSQTIQLGFGDNRLVNCTFAASGSVPTTLFTHLNVATTDFLVRDCNLSVITGTLVTFTTGTGGSITLQNCKLASGVTLTSSASVLVNPADSSIIIQNCDSSGTTYRETFSNYMGAQSTSTSIYRANSIATDGTNNFSVQIATTANSKFLFPFESNEFIVWNDFVNIPRAMTLYFTSATASLNNDDVWIGVEYLGNASYPMSTYDTSTRCAMLATHTALPSDASTWTGGLGNNYQIALTFTPRLPGLIRTKIIVARASLTINCDFPTLT